MSNSYLRNAGSFRDPSGHVYERDGLIFRTVASASAVEYEAARDTGLFDRLVGSGKLVDLKEVDPGALFPLAAERHDLRYLLQHSRIPFVSWPYEWSFSLLREAALFHLDLHLGLLKDGFTLSDASAYNVQFIGPNPIFIDHLSVRRYREGEFWTGHRQFCEQFLTPLLLRSFCGIAHNAWYRGNFEGIPISDLARLLPWRRCVSWNVFTHIILQNRFQRRADARQPEGGQEHEAKTADIRKRRLPRVAYGALLTQLRKWIARLTPADTGGTVWGEYADRNTYTDGQAAEKRRFVEDFVDAVRPETLFDLGCNTGDYSKLALSGSAARVIGFDFDHGALDQAYHRARAEALDFLPLFFDARNPSPDQGWLQAERGGWRTRAKADAVLALAFEHHLAIAHNVPLDRVVDWIVGIAPAGVIEFVPKDDPTVRAMLALREDIFPDYGVDLFAGLIERRARIQRRMRLSDSGRTLFWYTR